MNQKNKYKFKTFKIEQILPTLLLWITRILVIF